MVGPDDDVPAGGLRAKRAPSGGRGGSMRWVCITGGGSSEALTVIWALPLRTGSGSHGGSITGRRTSGHIGGSSDVALMGSGSGPFAQAVAMAAPSWDIREMLPPRRGGSSPAMVGSGSGTGPLRTGFGSRGGSILGRRDDVSTTSGGLRPGGDGTWVWPLRTGFRSHGGSIMGRWDDVAAMWGGWRCWEWALVEPLHRGIGTWRTVVIKPSLLM